MPAIYMSYEIETGMSVEQKQEKLYLGVISAGEQAYTLGAALAECRKQLTSLDELVNILRHDFQTLKAERHTKEGKMTERQICSPESPMPKGATGRWAHTNVEEVGRQRNGWPCGDDQDYRCKDCGHEWTEELPQ